MFTRMFQESDRNERRRSRRHFRLLKRVDGTIREIVEPSEKVVFLTGGQGLSFWERWVLGWRRAVVLTDSRAIFLQLDARRRPRLLHEQVAYGAVARVKDGRSAGVEVETHRGDAVELRGLVRADRDAVAERLRSGARAMAGMTAASGIERLCPYCYKALSGRPRSCPSCLRDFRRGWLSALASLAIPGLGNYRNGYRGFAVLELLIAVVVWAAYLFGPEARAVTGVRGMVSPWWIFAIVHGADAVLTWHIARTGVFPSGRG